MSPEKNLDAKFCIHGVVWSLLTPSDSLKLHKYFFQQSWICAFKCAIDWTPKLRQEVLKTFLYHGATDISDVFFKQIFIIISEGSYMIRRAGLSINRTIQNVQFCDVRTALKCLLGRSTMLRKTKLLDIF